MPRPNSIEQRLLKLLALPFEAEWADRVIEWASDALVDGRDSPSLRMLAGLHPVHDREDVSRLLEASVRELGLQPVRDPWEIHALWIVEGLLDKSLSLRDALTQAWLLDTYRHDGAMSKLASLSYLIDDAGLGHVDPRALRADARAEAERVREALKPPRPTSPFR